MRRSSNRKTELVLDGAEDCGFDATKGEVEAVDLRDRELIFVWIAI